MNKTCYQLLPPNPRECSPKKENIAFGRREPFAHQEHFLLLIIPEEPVGSQLMRALRLGVVALSFSTEKASCKRMTKACGRQFVGICT